jgi:hypothetical protein
MWSSNIKAIVQATLRTINMAIIQLAVHQEPYINALCDTRLRMYPETTRQRHALAREATLFGAVQKKYGFEQLIGSMQQVFLDRGVDANMVIVPADTAALLRCRQETRDYALNGALAQQYQIDPMRTIPSYIYNERFTLFEHRGMYVNQSGQRDSPMVRQRSIGQFFVINPTDEAIRIIDHDNQRWHTITRLEAEKFAGNTNSVYEVDFDTQDRQAYTQARAGAQINLGAIAHTDNWNKKGWVASRAAEAQAHFAGVTADNFGTKEIQTGLAALGKDLRQDVFGAELGPSHDLEQVVAAASPAAKVLFGDKVTSVKTVAGTGKIIIFRPNLTFNMGAVVAGRGGEETGFTAFGNANFELSDEATTKTALGHYTCYFKPIVHTPRNLMVSPDAVFQGYVGGGGVTPYKNLKEYAENPYAARGPSGGEGKDLYFVRVPDDWSCDGVMSSMGLSGEYASLIETCSGWGDKDKAKAVLERWAKNFENFNVNAKTSSGEDMEIPFNERRFGINHLCYQGTQVTVDDKGKESYTPARGHLADCEYPDSSIREWSGHVSFRDEPIPVETDGMRGAKRSVSMR